MIFRAREHKGEHQIGQQTYAHSQRKCPEVMCVCDEIVIHCAEAQGGDEPKEHRQPGHENQRDIAFETPTPQREMELDQGAGHACASGAFGSAVPSELAAAALVPPVSGPEVSTAEPCPSHPNEPSASDRPPTKLTNTSVRA